MRQPRQCGSLPLSASWCLGDVCRPPGVYRRGEGQKLGIPPLLLVVLELENLGMDATLEEQIQLSH